jgi:two-component system, chemotaxis family, chemotaxis protein CheY
MTTRSHDVLVADDNDALRRAMQLALEAGGYRVQLAASGLEALELQRKDPANVLITDIFMPERDGFEAIADFRKEFPATKIIAMSGDATRVKGEYLSAAALIGVDATLRKPFKMAVLLQTLRSLGLPDGPAETPITPR